MDKSMSINSLEIGQRIAHRRKELGWTQEKAAEKVGLSHQFFACVERGVKNIRAESIVRISRAMNVSTDYILTGASTDIDREKLLTLLEPLSEVQLRCMEKIIINYLTACGCKVFME